MLTLSLLLSIVEILFAIGLLYGMYRLGAHIRATPAVQGYFSRTSGDWRKRRMHRWFIASAIIIGVFLFSLFVPRGSLKEFWIGLLLAPALLIALFSIVGVAIVIRRQPKKRRSSGAGDGHKDSNEDKEHSHAPAPPAPAGGSHAHGDHGHGSGGGAMLGFLLFCAGVALIVWSLDKAQNISKSPAPVHLTAASAEATAQVHARASETPLVYNLDPNHYCKKGAPKRARRSPLTAGPDWGEAIAIPQGQSFHCTGQMTYLQTVEFQCQPYEGAEFGPCGPEAAVTFRARSLTGLDEKYYSWMEDWEVQH